MSATCGFLDLPVELRLEVYEIVLAEHQRVRRRTQPSNAHIRLLYVCKQVEQEASPILKRYISLLHEHQIQTLLLRAHPSRVLAQVEGADVANDGRVYHVTEPEQEEEDTPLSSLHLALARMTALKRLRVFQCRQGLPLNLQSTMSLHREYPLSSALRTSVGLTTGVVDRISETGAEVRARDVPEAVPSAGHVRAAPQPRHARRALRHRPPARARRPPALRGAGRTPREACVRARPGSAPPHAAHHHGHLLRPPRARRVFPGARLRSFTYALGDRLGFELRNHHLESLATTALGAGLRTLVLLDCSRLSSGVITRCLKSLPRLEHFALHLVTVDELRSNFVLALPPSLSVFKLQVVNAWYAIPLRDEERGLCDAIEKVVLLRDRPFEHVCVCFREQLLTEDGRRERWLRIAEERGLKLNIGPWGSQMADEV